MRRRKFIGLFGSATSGVVLSWPQAAHGQQPEQVRRVGVLMAYTQDDAEAQKYLSVFRDSLKEFGWVEGRNLSMVEHWPGPGFAAIQQAAKDLLRQEPEVILSSSTPTRQSITGHDPTKTSAGFVGSVTLELAFRCAFGCTGPRRPHGCSATTDGTKLHLWRWYRAGVRRSMCSWGGIDAKRS